MESPDPGSEVPGNESLSPHGVPLEDWMINPGWHAQDFFKAQHFRAWDDDYLGRTLADNVFLPMLLMAQGHLAVRLAYLRAGWGRMDFEHLTLTATPSSGWAAHKNSAIRIAASEAIREELSPALLGDKAWLRKWTSLATRTSLVPIWREAVVTIAAFLAVLVGYVVVACVLAASPARSMRSLLLLTLTDGALVSGLLERTELRRSALLVILSHLAIASHPDAKTAWHGVVALVVALRLCFLSVRAVMQHGMSLERRLNALRHFAAWNDRPAPERYRAALPGLRFLFIAVLAGLLVVDLVCEALPHIHQVRRENCRIMDSMQAAADQLASNGRGEDAQKILDRADFSRASTYCSSLFPESVWCDRLSLSDRLASLAVPALPIGLLIILVHRWVHRGRFQAHVLLAPTVGNMVALNGLACVALAVGVFWSWMPAMLCAQSVWTIARVGMRSVLCTSFGLCGAGIFFYRWKQKYFQDDLLAAILGFSSMLLLAAGCPSRLQWIFEGAHLEWWDFYDLVYIYAVAEFYCAFIIWHSYFGTGFHFRGMSWAGTFVGGFASTGVGIILQTATAIWSWHVDVCEEKCIQYICVECDGGRMIRSFAFQGFHVPERTLVACTFIAGPPLMLMVAIKSAHLWELVQAEDGGADEDEKDLQRAKRLLCYMHLSTAFAAVTALIAFIASIGRMFILLSGSLLVLVHGSTWIFQLEYLVSPRRYPRSFQCWWLILYCAGLVAAIVASTQSFKKGMFLGSFVTEMHLLNFGYVIQVRSRQGLSRGVRSQYYAYSPLLDRVAPLRAARLHPLFWSVVAGTAWTGALVYGKLLPAFATSVTLVRITLHSLWRQDWEHKVDVPAWLVEAVPAWSLEEGIRVWTGGDDPDQQPTPQLLVKLMEERAEYVERIRNLANTKAEFAQAAWQELRGVRMSTRCNILLWELRVSMRLQGLTDYLTSALLAHSAALQLQVDSIDELLCLDEPEWRDLMDEWASPQAQAKLDEQARMRHAEALQEADRQRSAAAAANRLAVGEPGGVPGDLAIKKTNTEGQVGKVLSGRSSNAEEAAGLGGLLYMIFKCLRQSLSDENAAGADVEADVTAQRERWLMRRRILEQGGPGSFFDKDFPAMPPSLGSVAQRVPGSRWVRASELFAGLRCVLREKSLAKSWNVGDQRVAKGRNRDSIVAQELVDAAKQGMLGDCWLLSAMSALCTRPSVLEAVFLDPPELSTSGAYCFRLFVHGHPQEVIVDDQVPVYQAGVDRHLQPAFARPHRTSTGEVVLWPLLLEKAFAKLYGSYGAIEAGQVHEALMDMTGGLGEMIKIRASCGTPLNPDSLWAKLCHLKRAGHLLTAGSQGTSDVLVSPRGIVQAHAYSILQVRVLPGNIRLLKLRNPWGMGAWRGDYGVGSPLWTPELRARLRWSEGHDGVIWMLLRDFMCEFECVFTCCVFKSEAYERQVVHGSWPAQAHSPRASLALEVRRGRGPVYLQLQQADVRGTWARGCPIRMEVSPLVDARDDLPFGASPFMAAATSRTPISAEREVALEVVLNAGRYNVIAQLCGTMGGVFHVTVFSHRHMQVSISTPTLSATGPMQPVSGMGTVLPGSGEAHGMPQVACASRPAWADDTRIPVRNVQVNPYSASSGGPSYTGSPSIHRTASTSTPVSSSSSIAYDWSWRPPDQLGQPLRGASSSPYEKPCSSPGYLGGGNSLSVPPSGGAGSSWLEMRHYATTQAAGYPPSSGSRQPASANVAWPSQY